MPDVSWVLSLYRQHKLDHDDYMELSVKMREPYDTRKATADAVLSAELALSFQEERRLALDLIAARSKPMKPLTPATERWNMHYEENDDR